MNSSSFCREGFTICNLASRASLKDTPPPIALVVLQITRNYTITMFLIVCWIAQCGIQLYVGRGKAELDLNQFKSNTCYRQSQFTIPVPLCPLHRTWPVHPEPHPPIGWSPRQSKQRPPSPMTFVSLPRSDP